MTRRLEPGQSADVRAAVGLAIRERSASLVSDLSSALATIRHTDTDPLQAPAQLLVELMATAAEQGELTPQSGTVFDLQALCPNPFTVRELFEAIYHAERTVLDELALHEQVGATSELWPLVSYIIRLGALEIATVFTERSTGTPAHGAVRDPLTTLLARPVFDLALEQEAQRAQRYESPLSLILFDVDCLSQVNTEHGYGVGDRLLERLGILARRFFRTYDWIARHGEDSIVVLLPQTTVDDAASLANRFRLTIQQRIILVEHKTGGSIAVTLSAATVGTDRVQSEIDPAYILEEAEAAVMRAKLNGRNRLERVALLPTSLTLLGAATMLDCSPKTVRHLVRAGHLKATRRGRHYHIDRTMLERYRAAQAGRQG